MKRSILTTLIMLSVLGTFVGLLAATQDSGSDDYAMLRKQIADISLRVSRLEQAAGVAPGAVDSGTPNASPMNIPRSMVVGGMNTTQGPPVDPNEVARLQQDADSLQKTVDFHKDQAAMVAADTYYVGGAYSDGHTGYNHSMNGRDHAEMAAEGMANRYATEASIKRQKLKKMQEVANEPHQTIHGHDGNVFFTLMTTLDLSQSLSEINIGDIVTWKGRRVSADETSETWEVSIIEKVESK